MNDLATDLNYTVSSRLTAIYKFLPSVVFVYLGGWVIYGWLIIVFASSVGNSVSISNLLSLTVLDIFIGLMALWLTVPLKTARIEGDKLIVGNFLKEIEVPISNISSISGPDISSLRRIKIYLHHKSSFGAIITVTPGFLRASNVARFLRECLESS